MRYVVIITFLTTLSHALCQGIFGLLHFNDYDITDFEYPFMMTLVIFTLPILAATIFTGFIFPRFIKTKNKFIKVVLLVFSILLIIMAALICWILLDMQYLDFDYTYTFNNLLKQFKGVYLEFIPMALLIPLMILFLDKKLAK